MKVGDVLNLIERECTVTVISEEIGELWNGLLMDVPEMTKQLPHIYLMKINF